jgi:predicted DNA-binding protein with PD1-like motif
MPKEKEIVTKIVEYVEKNLKKGYSLEELKWALINQKYSKIEINKALEIISARTNKAKQEERQKEILAATVVEENQFDEIEKGFMKKFFKKFKK